MCLELGPFPTNYEILYSFGYFLKLHTILNCAVYLLFKYKNPIAFKTILFSPNLYIKY